MFLLTDMRAREHHEGGQGGSSSKNPTAKLLK